MPEEIEDVYDVFVREKYCGYRCDIRKQSEGTFSVFITGDEKEYSTSTELKIDVKAIYRTIAKELKDLV